MRLRKKARRKTTLIIAVRSPRRNTERSPTLWRHINDALNRLAKEYNIVDDQGQLFHFKNHAFRHTKGVELINNGMNLVACPEVDGTCSPEMTLRYAKILDTTMRKSWEEATKNGLFRIDPRETGKD